MKKGPGYELWFGKFKGKTVEQLMFHPEGRDYFHYILKKFTEPKYDRLKEKIREMLEKGENIIPKVECQCNRNTAKYFSVTGVNYNISSLYIYCDICKKTLGHENAILVPIKFSSVSLFQSLRVRKAVIELIKFCLFGKPYVTISKKLACEFFEKL